MQQIINFIIRFKNFLLFLFLFCIALTFTILSHSYHTSKFINSANFFTGGFYKSFHHISRYMNLNSQNDLLAEENRALRDLLYNTESLDDSTYIDTASYKNDYRVYSAQVIKNSYSITNNILTLNKGKKDSIQQDLGVISSKGIIGIIEKTSANYSSVLSILNTTSRISAQLKKTNHFGTLVWEGVSPEYIKLIDIPKIAPVQPGDTIITSGRSSIFPKGIQIGIVNDFKLDQTENYYEVQVKLFNDMTDLEHVYIIENLHTEEIKSLQRESADE
ncbi:rod shape-determining protein MreC [Tamlana sp. 2_MG-2023]|uniref:rod shape-determining protein MreC n=1 Tax=unclassified Tamlana TaxID=2614803 RepID=UPI0026E4342E|nr:MULTISPECIES: rod shape-determining protein MreC [unclassified Tamlana]MDO6760759.1 rod shape-determining protein MreC [Tamlana sp. 2_MG-2023]MDO6791015.1 rod shape-determining protein MreC [Tamlana sp. 1_MG-2023]